MSMSWKIILDNHKNAIMIPNQINQSFVILKNEELLQLSEKELELYYQRLEETILYNDSYYDLLEEQEEDKRIRDLEEEYYDSDSSFSEYE